MKLNEFVRLVEGVEESESVVTDHHVTTAVFSERDVPSLLRDTPNMQCYIAVQFGLYERSIWGDGDTIIVIDMLPKQSRDYFYTRATVMEMSIQAFYPNYLKHLQDIEIEAIRVLTADLVRLISTIDNTEKLAEGSEDNGS